MKKTNETILKVYQVKRKLYRNILQNYQLVNITRKKGIGEKTASPINRAHCNVSNADMDLDWLLDRLEGILPDDVDDEGNPYSNDEVVKDIIDELDEAVKDLDVFLAKRDDEDAKNIQNIIKEEAEVLKGV